MKELLEKLSELVDVQKRLVKVQEEDLERWKGVEQRSIEDRVHLQMSYKVNQLIVLKYLREEHSLAVKYLLGHPKEDSGLKMVVNYLSYEHNRLYESMTPLETGFMMLDTAEVILDRNRLSKDKDDSSDV
jgi:hypothetical protein